MSGIYAIVVCCSVFFAAFVGAAKSESDTSAGAREGPPAEAIERLSQVFGIDRVPVHIHGKSPPEFMLQLYDTVAYSDGISKQPVPYQSDVVRGFPDRATTHQMHFWFNVSLVKKTEGVLQAEFHLYKMRGRPPREGGAWAARPVHLVQLRLYQVLEDEGIYSLENLKLVDVRRVSSHTTGWEVFNVSDSVRAWVNDSSTNHGFLVTATSSLGDHVNGSYARFAQRYEHHQSKQPVLVTYTEDHGHQHLLFDQGEGRYRDDQQMESWRRNYVQYLNEGYRAEHGALQPKARRNYMSPIMHQQLLLDTERSRASSRSRPPRDQRPKRFRPVTNDEGEGDTTLLARTKRSKRSSDYFRRRRRKLCARTELYVDFDEIGWSGWIISPKGYNAYHCKGDCSFPLGQNQHPTNHATVQSIVHAMKINRDVDMPCCVPDKLYSISLLYFDDDENVILKQYDDMVAANCGCN